MEELVDVAGHFSNAVEVTGANVYHWRQELDKKYTELQGIRKYHDFVVSRDANNTAQLKIREACGFGDFVSGNMKLRSGSSPQLMCIPPSSSNYLNSKRPLSSEKISDMVTMYSRFIDPERWPSYITEIGNEDTSTEQATTSTTTATARQKGKRKHCSVPGCNGTGHKNVQRWSEGHTTRAGCPIYHGINAP